MGDRLAAGRLMIFDLDSVNQRERWATGFHEPEVPDDDPAREARLAPRLSPVGVLSTDGLEWFAGVLRTADLLSETIVLTDAQLLDGIFFQSLGVERVLDLLGRSDVQDPPITVIGRGVSLEESLRAIAVSGDALSGFEYSTLQVLGVSPTDLAALGDGRRVAQAPPGHVAQVLGEVLGAATGTPAGHEYCTELARSWQGWVRAEHLGLIRYERFSPPAPGAFAEAIEVWEAPPVAAAAEPLLAELRATPRRSDARRLMDDAVTAGQISHERREVVEAWWERAYADFLAANNGADWIDMFGGRFDAIRTLRGESGGRRTTVLRGQAPQILGRMPSPRYAIFVWANRTVLHGFRTRGGQDDVDAVAYAVQRADAEVDLASDRRALAWGLAVSLGAVLVVFGLGFLTAMPTAAWLVPIATLAVTLAAEIYAVREPIRAVRRSTLESTLYLGGTA